MYRYSYASDEISLLIIIAIILLQVVCGGMASALAAEKGHGEGAGFLLGLAFGILGVLFEGLRPKNPNFSCSSEIAELRNIKKQQKELQESLGSIDQSLKSIQRLLEKGPQSGSNAEETRSPEEENILHEIELEREQEKKREEERKQALEKVKEIEAAVQKAKEEAIEQEKRIQQEKTRKIELENQDQLKTQEMVLSEKISQMVEEFCSSSQDIAPFIENVSPLIGQLVSISTFPIDGVKNKLLLPAKLEVIKRLGKLQLSTPDFIKKIEEAKEKEYFESVRESLIQEAKIKAKEKAQQIKNTLSVSQGEFLQLCAEEKSRSELTSVLGVTANSYQEALEEYEKKELKYYRRAIAAEPVRKTPVKKRVGNFFFALFLILLFCAIGWLAKEFLF